MPIANIQDAYEVANSLQAVLTAPNDDDRTRAIRSLFVETLDFDRVDRKVPLGAANNPNLPTDARLLARRGGFSVLYIPLDGTDDNRVKAETASAAAKVINETIADEPLLQFTNRDCDQLHLIYPDLSGSRARLSRMVAHRGQPARTVVQQIANLWQDYGESDKTMGEAIRNAFSVQPVTKAFFEDYKAAYDIAVNMIATGIGQSDAEQFTQMLFNRLLFIHFVSRKGWLRFNGDTDYLNALWRDYRENEMISNFYTGRLNSLFFSGLNNPKSQNLFKGVRNIIGEVPYLNGGLFEETELDAGAAKGDFAVHDDIVALLLGDGQEPGLFNCYNFTVSEATPLDIEVAVDPEMLGKLFEETVNERHSNGAYYTPRPVVAFMCREAIKGHLASQDIIGMSDDKIADLVDNTNPQVVTMMQAREIANSIAAMKVIDPACGSGAFLLGMLHEIMALNKTLFQAGHTEASYYRQKLDIISNNIYGVDKDGLAVSTAMLRLWLSLAVDYDGDGPPAPLPNLDLKLAVGDAVAGPNPQQLDLTIESIVTSSLQQDIADYTTAQGQRKAMLKEKVDVTKAQLHSSLQGAAPAGTVEWRIDFADVMLNGGFDVVVANPPYVRQEDIGPTKNLLVRQYGDAVTARSDLYCHFYVRGLQLLRDGGTHVFVCSNSWLDVGYGARLQEYLLNNAHVQAIYESAVERQFATADINTIISIIHKTGTADDDLTRFVSLRADFETALNDGDQRREITKTKSDLQAGGTAPPDNRNRRKFVGDKWGGKYLRAPDIYHVILDNYRDRLVRLGDVATVQRGIMTGANGFFYLTPERIAEFGIEPEYCSLVMTSPQESRSIAVIPTELPRRIFMCHADKDALAGTGALAYIQWGESQGYHTGTSVKSRRRWYDLGERDASQLALNYVIGTTARTYYFQHGCLVPNVFHTAQCKFNQPLQLCAALNSTLAQLVINLSGRVNLGGGALKLELYEFGSLQIVNPQLLSKPDTGQLTSVDWDVLTPSPVRRSIDDEVFDVLGMTAGERKAVYAGVTELVENRLRRARSV